MTTRRPLTAVASAAAVAAALAPAPAHPHGVGKIRNVDLSPWRAHCTWSM